MTGRSCQPIDAGGRRGVRSTPAESSRMRVLRGSWRGVRGRTAWPLVACVTAIVATVSPAPAVADVTAMSTIDGAGGGGGRINADISDDTHAVVFGGVPHVFYYDATGGNLRHAWRPGATWLFETVDGAGGGGGRISANVGRTMSAVANASAINVFYLDSTGGNLRQATFQAQQGWRFATLDGAGGAAGRVNGVVGGGSSSLYISGQLNVFYADSTNKDVRRGVLGASGWTFSVLDGAGGGGGRLTNQMGGYTRVAVVGGVPHVLYTAFDYYDVDFDFAWGFIRDARLVNGAWTMVNVASHPWSNLGNNLAAQVVSGQLSVATTWLGIHSTKVVMWRLAAGAWGALVQPQCAGDEGYEYCQLTGLTIRGGRLGLLYWDYFSPVDSLLYREFDGSAWTTPRGLENATGEGASSVVINGITQVFYANNVDANGDLRGGPL